MGRYEKILKIIILIALKNTHNYIYQYLSELEVLSFFFFFFLNILISKDTKQHINYVIMYLCQSWKH